MRRIRTIITSAAAAIVLVPVAIGLSAATASAEPDHGEGYPSYQYEGQYPEATPCSYGLVQQETAEWNGRQVGLKYYYSDGCGSFGRIDNAPRDCSVIVDRSTDGGKTWAWVSESVDPGLDFAYTQVGNNLEGRVSRAALVCGNGEVQARTDWY